MRKYNKFYYICIIHKALNCLSTRFLNCLWLRERLGFMLQRQSNKHVRIKKLKERNRKKNGILTTIFNSLRYVNNFEIHFFLPPNKIFKCYLFQRDLQCNESLFFNCFHVFYFSFALLCFLCQQ